MIPKLGRFDDVRSGILGSYPVGGSVVRRKSLFRTTAVELVEYPGIGHPKKKL